MINLAPDQLAEVRAILARHLPAGCGVLVFGSRVTADIKAYSDLDLALVSSGPLGLDCIGRVREAFADSSLPIRVDILDWQQMPPSFRKVIADQHEVLITPIHAYAT